MFLYTNIFILKINKLITIAKYVKWECYRLWKYKICFNNDRPYDNKTDIVKSYHINDFHRNYYIFGIFQYLCQYFRIIILNRLPLVYVSYLLVFRDKSVFNIP